MLIKVMTHDKSIPSYMMFDNVETIEWFSPAPILVTDVEEFNNMVAPLVGSSSINRVLIINPVVLYPHKSGETGLVLNTERPYRFNEIRFTRNGKTTDLVFDTVAYICNDKGETLEKCSTY